MFIQPKGSFPVHSYILGSLIVHTAWNITPRLNQLFSSQTTPRVKKPPKVSEWAGFNQFASFNPTGSSNTVFVGLIPLCILQMFLCHHTILVDCKQTFTDFRHHDLRKCMTKCVTVGLWDGIQKKPISSTYISCGCTSWPVQGMLEQWGGDLVNPGRQKPLAIGVFSSTDKPRKAKKKMILHTYEQHIINCKYLSQNVCVCLSFRLNQQKFLTDTYSSTSIGSSWYAAGAKLFTFFFRQRN